ncbi:pentapeptide repeat-containing protein [Nostoc sp. WHI]|uniref:pentapeptide repeat-containing protein n=1 Tax=Nostoc sp. WHI TaxID=2650611 RepID=UPI0018C7DD48|nr:pentapeptide repeat-containing protein [Nostoc sp. WHI]MBG1265708.1 pentapeptide repeat-containing protein [Nostoc sp. WHI]
MPNQRHLDLLQNSNCTTWNEFRLQNPEFTPDLSNTNLSDKDLSYRNLRGANLSNADLRGAYLMEVDFSNADLRGSDFSPFPIISPPNRYSYGNLSGQEVLTPKQSDLSFANFTNANLVGANLAEAKFWKTTMPNGEIKFNY